jgi:hypothetical protein
LIILSGGNKSYSQARGTLPAEEMQAFFAWACIPQEALVLQKHSLRIPPRMRSLPSDFR